ncbi:MAG: general secretion pathway protein GspK [Zoogloeaceae bacterium]|jgi:general secretion pathway protein K|nr:general secretion pathway protein GspK [Zoogloeaceae bacterium]
MLRHSIQCLPRQRGYILLLCIGVLALLMLGATYMGRQMETALTLARAEQRQIEQEKIMLEARTHALFLLASMPRTMQGLGSGEALVVPDGRFYRVNDGIAVSFQDVRGLLSLNLVRDTGMARQMLERLLGTYGVSSEVSAQLIDALLDYRDPDNLRHINGAEVEEYRAAGKEHLLKNGDLVLPQELTNVLGWAEVAALWGNDPITRYLSVNPRPVLNPNTAGWRVLTALSGTNPEVVKDLLGSRQRGDIADLTPLVAPTLSDNPFSNGPMVIKLMSDEILVTFLAQGEKHGLRLDVVHTPLSPQAPWRIAYTEKVAGEEVLRDWDKLPQLPDIRLIQNTPLPNQVELPF